jgi:hypothetical protein
MLSAPATSQSGIGGLGRRYGCRWGGEGEGVAGAESNAGSVGP